jgi:plasmid stabilization system protein ParE
MNFRFTPRAESEAEKKQAWWRENRLDAAELFDDELAAILRRITKTPTLGTIYPSAFDAVVRRVLMAKTKNHVYYAVHEGEVVVLSVWGAPRRRGPKL